MIKEPPQVRVYKWRSHMIDSRIQGAQSSFRDFAVSLTVDGQAYAFLMALTQLEGRYRLMNLRRIKSDGTSKSLLPNRQVAGARSIYALGVNLCIDDFEDTNESV